MTVHISLIQAQAGAQIGCLALSAPERINAQNLAMVRQMAAALAQWAQDEQIVAVVLIGAGERGFCAGGDLKALYQAMNDNDALADGDAFFAEEYNLCQTIREYTKPVMAWGHGIVMGGGWGLFAAASHRVVTETSRLAMPETGIGLFPDVAASWWLPKLAGAGRFLALSGTTINAQDAIDLGAAQWALPDAVRHECVMALAHLPWQGNRSRDHAMLATYLSEWAARSVISLPAAQVMPHLAPIRALAEMDFHSAVQQMCAWHQCDDLWLQHAAQRVQKAAPMSLYLSWQMQTACRHYSLAQTVALETQMAACALRFGDFKAGIYATLVDRSAPAHWQMQHIAEIMNEDLAVSFAPLAQALRIA